MILWIINEISYNAIWRKFTTFWIQIQLLRWILYKAYIMLLFTQKKKDNFLCVINIYCTCINIKLQLSPKFLRFKKLSIMSKQFLIIFCLLINYYTYCKFDIGPSKLWFVFCIVIWSNTTWIKELRD